jgi:phospholipase C
MLENHPFDNIFWMLGRGDGFRHSAPVDVTAVVESPGGVGR